MRLAWQLSTRSSRSWKSSFTSLSMKKCILRNFKAVMAHYRPQMTIPPVPTAFMPQPVIMPPDNGCQYNGISAAAFASTSKCNTHKESSTNVLECSQSTGESEWATYCTSKQQWYCHCSGDTTGSHFSCGGDATGSICLVCCAHSTSESFYGCTGAGCECCCFRAKATAATAFL